MTDHRQRAEQLAKQWFSGNCMHTVDEYEAFKQECVGGCLVSILANALAQVRRETWEEAGKVLAEAIHDAPHGIDTYALIHHIVADFSRRTTQKNK